MRRVRRPRFRVPSPACRFDAGSRKETRMITFYFHHTPNPMKVALMLEEAQLAYEVVPVDIF